MKEQENVIIENSKCEFPRWIIQGFHQINLIPALEATESKASYNL